MTKLVGGYCHTLALREEGKCSLSGDGMPTSNEVWRGVAGRGMSEVHTGGLPVKDIAAGANHSIAVSKDRQTRWGSSSNDLAQAQEHLGEEHQLLHVQFARASA